MHAATTKSTSGPVRTAALAGWLAAAAVLAPVDRLMADGMAVPPSHYKGVPYKGSIEERSQEAIVIFHGSRRPGEAREDVVLRISVVGEVENFAWIVPFPSEPEVAREDNRLFEELYEYVEARLARPAVKHAHPSDGADAPAAETADKPPVEVLSRKIVGSFDVAVVRENKAGALNGWLEAEGYRTLSDADDVLSFYHRKKYVYACVKVSQAQLNRDKPVDLHPLRFSFKTGGRDGIFFPMKLTGLQQQPFDVNLYVFYKAWLNDHLSKFGYEHRGFRLKYRDWDTRACKPNGGKTYSTPQHDVFLKNLAHRIPTLTALFQKLHPGQRYYLTNIQARGLKPQAVRHWADDLWLFPYYVNREFIPYDARPDGPASAAWPDATPPAATKASPPKAASVVRLWPTRTWLTLAAGAAVAIITGVVIGIGITRRKASDTGATGS